jgi:hypothetical protein
MAVNISLAACSLVGDSDEFVRRFDAAAEYVDSLFESGEETSRRAVTRRSGIYNGQRTASAWKVPTWIDAGDEDVISFSAPPIPRVDIAGAK